MSWLSKAWHSATDWISDVASDVGGAVSRAWYDGTEWLEQQTGMSIEQIALTVAATALTAGVGGFAVAVGEAALGAVGAGAVAGETIVGSATVASVTGGTIIGAGTGAVSGATQAALVGADIGEGIIKGAVVGAVGGGAGMLAAGAAQGVLASEVANGTIASNEAKAITNAVQRVTANTIGAAIQGKDIGQAAATGAISGLATPLVQEYTGFGNVASAIVGGGISGAGSAGVTGGNLVAGTVGGAVSGGVGAAIGPTLEQTVRSVLQGTPATSTPASQEISSAPLTHQETLNIMGYLNQVAAEGQAQGLPEQEQEARRAIEAMDQYYRQNESRFRNEDMMAMLGLSNVGATTGGPATLTAGEGEADVTAEDYTPATKTLFTQEIVPDDTSAQYYGEDAAAGAAKSGNLGDYEAYAKSLQESPYVPKITGTPGSKTTAGTTDLLKLLGGGTTGNVSGNLTSDILKLIGGDKGITGNVTLTNVSSGTGGPTTLGNATVTSSDATPEPTGLQPFGSDATAVDTTTLQPFGQDREEEKTTEATTTKKLPEPRVYTPPVYIDPKITRRAATAAPSPVVSAGGDPATSGVILGKYGKKNQVWNEATLRLADALGIR